MTTKKRSSRCKNLENHKISLKQSNDVQQSLDELIHQTKEIGKLAHSLQPLILSQVAFLGQQSEKEKKYSRKFVPLYDREKFDQNNQLALSKIKQIISRISLEFQILEDQTNSHQNTINRIKLEVANG